MVKSLWVTKVATSVYFDLHSTKSRNLHLSLKMPLNTLRVGHYMLTANVKEYQWLHRVCVCSPYCIQCDIQRTFLRGEAIIICHKPCNFIVKEQRLGKGNCNATTVTRCTTCDMWWSNSWQSNFTENFNTSDYIEGIFLPHDSLQQTSSPVLFPFKILQQVWWNA
jgi:hypothetical protein